MNFLLQNKILSCNKCPDAIHIDRVIQSNLKNIVAICIFESVDEYRFNEITLKLKQINWPMDKTYITSMVKCKNIFYVDNCKLFFLQEIMVLNPLALITVGFNLENYFDKSILKMPIFNIDSFDESINEYWLDIGRSIKKIINDKKIEFGGNIINGR